MSIDQVGVPGQTNNAAAFTVDSDTQIPATTPAGAIGAVDVTVTTGGGTSAVGANDKFTYAVGAPISVPVPSLSGLSLAALSILLLAAAALSRRRKR